MVVHSSSDSSVDMGHGSGQHTGADSGGRKLILCFDGTGNLFDDTNTNVVKLVSFLKKEDRRHQMVYYQTGVGTSVKKGWWESIKQAAAFAVGWDIKYHIMGGYMFLMQNWVPGDRIYLFGFSRGAYTARALAGMLHKVGLLPRGNDEQVAFAYDMYMRTDIQGWKDSLAYRETFCSSVSIDFVGVWDTVESVGIFRNMSFPFTSSGNHIRIFRHAISLDERRIKFKANHYHANLKLGELPQEVLDADAKAGLDDTDVKEVWFAGGHGEVGGGNFTNDELYDPARITLAWMLREIVLTDTGIEFDEEAAKKLNFKLPDPPKNGRMTNGKAQPEESPILPVHYVRNIDERYERDVTAKITDQLLLTPGWWFLEIFPFSHMHHGPNGEVTYKWVPNLGKGRGVPHLPPTANVHVSVKERMEAAEGYLPKANSVKNANWVE